MASTKEVPVVAAVDMVVVAATEWGAAIAEARVEVPAAIVVATIGVAIERTADHDRHQAVQWEVEHAVDTVAVVAAAADRIARAIGTVASVATKTLPGATNVTVARRRKVMVRAVARTVAVEEDMVVRVAIAMEEARAVAVGIVARLEVVGVVVLAARIVDTAVRVVGDATTVVPEAMVVEQ